MKLFEYQGKALFTSHGIRVPRSVLAETESIQVDFAFPVVVKSQVLSGDRNKKGGIKIAHTNEQLSEEIRKVLQTAIDGVFPEKVLLEEKIDFEKEWYVRHRRHRHPRGKHSRTFLGWGSLGIARIIRPSLAARSGASVECF
jgi:succinyl-CoA synthetase beta subunit